MSSDSELSVFSPDCGIKISKWKVREGFQVSIGQVILFYVHQEGEDKEIKRLKSTNSGVVKKRLFKDGDVVGKGVPILLLGACSHPTVIKDMCADCGADLRQNKNGNVSEIASIPMVHSVPELKVSHKLAQKLGQEDTERLLRDKKLVLLVDLDQTLIHTTNDNVPNNLKDVYHFQLYGPKSPWYHTRLRPGTPKFLNNMAPFFELHICTFGAHLYAHQIALFLDESGKFFSHRILSRDECLSITSKNENLKALFPCGDSMVCIIDDREDVWNMALNLIQVKPYHFFQHTGDINAPPGMSKHELDGKGMSFKDLADQKEKKRKDSESEKAKTEEEEKEKLTGKEESVEQSSSATEKGAESQSKEEEDDSKLESENSKAEAATTKSEDRSSSNCDSDDQLIEIEDPDDYLLYLEQILMKIHARFYEIYETTKEIPDLKVLIPKMRSEILVGSNLVFSGLVPNHLKLEQSKAFQIARGIGATVSQDFTEATTHLVAAASGTIKVNTARKRAGTKIVTPDWLWCCAERWEHVDERLFPLDPNKPSKMRQPPPHCHSPEHAVNYGGDSKAESSTKFIDTINPLLSFSNADIAEMNKDFDQFFESDDSSSDDDQVDIENPPMKKALRKRRRQEDKEEKAANLSKPTAPIKLNFETNEESRDTKIGTSTTEEDEDESPSAKFRRGGNLPSDLELGSNSEGSEDPIDEEDDGDWNMMGAALEREFLGLDE